MKSISVDVDVYVDEIIDQISTDDLIEELRSRQGTLPASVDAGTLREKLEAAFERGDAKAFEAALELLDPPKVQDARRLKMLESYKSAPKGLN